MRLAFLQADGRDLLWQERRADGKTALKRWRAGTVEELGLVRSRVHEYGGRAFAARDGRVVVEEDGPTGDHFLAADGSVVFVREGESASELVRARPNPPGTGIVHVPGGFGDVVASGRDFYGAPRLSDDGRLAYLCWDLPDMPWDGAELWIDDRHVAGGNGVAAMQPTWLRDGSLLWMDDRTGWWNLYRDGAPVAPMDAEIGYPAWQLGFQNVCELHSGALAFTARSGGFDRLHVGGRALDLPFTEFQWLVAFGDGLACIAGGPSVPSSLVTVDPAGGYEVLRPGLSVELDQLTTPEHVSFAAAHALFYAPEHVERPPVIVLSHGGPTAAASSELDLEIQFFTSRGFAVADVNYRGSTGYGTAFRRALDGQWGIADVEDCVACVRHLAAAGRVDAERAIIRGGSAGGYTTLRALTATDAFAAGSSEYGVGDLVSLAEDTHRFESRYLDRLVAPWPEGRAVYAERSPVNHLDGLSAPVILFQGLDDKVVPPDQARRMAAALAAKGIDHELHLFAGEGHGFDRAETRQAVYEAEARFLARAVGSRAS